MLPITAIAPAKGPLGSLLETAAISDALKDCAPGAVILLLGLAPDHPAGYTIAQFEETARSMPKGATLVLGVLRLDTDPAADNTRPQTEFALSIHSLAQDMAPDIRVNGVTLRGIDGESEADALASAIAYLADAPAVTGQVVALAAPTLQGQPLED